jgi:hypothetical protein
MTPTKADEDAARDVERLASIQHEIWSHWMRWFFDNDTPENRSRWRRQMTTPYAELSEREKESDRRVVRDFGLAAFRAEARVAGLLKPEKP